MMPLKNGELLQLKDFCEILQLLTTLYPLSTFLSRETFCAQLFSIPSIPRDTVNNTIKSNTITECDIITFKLNFRSRLKGDTDFKISTTADHLKPRIVQ